MPGILGGGGSSVPAPTVNTNPAAGSAQFYQPQNQVGADTSYTALLNSLLGQYTSGSTPPQQLYPSAQESALDIRNLASPGGELNYILGQINANPYYGGALNAANTGASIFGGQQQLLADDLNAAITGGFTGQLGEGNYLSTLPGQIDPLAWATAGLAPTATALSASTAGLGPILAALEGQVAGGVAPTMALAGDVTGQIPGINQAARTLSGLSSGLLAAGSPLPNEIIRLAQSPEGVGALQSAAQNVLDQSQALAAAPAGAGKLMRGSTNLLNAGYDPQNALRKQLTQQTADQSSAINAMSGLASSPYGAGLTSDALNQFNINWENQQLGREQSALAGAAQGFGEASNLRQGRENLLTSGLGAASGAFGQAGSLLANKANMFGQALSGTEGLYQGAGGLATQDANALAQGAGVAGTAGGLYGQAAGIGGQAGALTQGRGTLNSQAAQQLLGAGGLYGQGISGLATGGQAAGQAANVYGALPGTANAATSGVGALASGAAGAGALPGRAFMGQQNAETTAINDLISALTASQGGATSASNIGTAQYALPESVLSLLGNYLKLGQNASLGGGQLGEIGTANAASSLGGINTLLGGGAGIGSTLFGSGGLGSAFGDSGLLGSLGGTAQDFSSGLGDTVTSATGGSGILGLFRTLFE